MSYPPPADIGSRLADVDTPALLVDLDAFERNLKRLPKLINNPSVRLRPHAKTHKCPTIARQQIALGAVGVCCQKVGEAEALVDGGVNDVLVSNEVIGMPKLRRLAALAHRATIGVCVDHLDAIGPLSDAACEANVTLNVLVEIDVGQGRCGVLPGEPALALAARVAQSPGLRFQGLQAYHGGVQQRREHAERKAAIDRAAALAAQTVALLAEHGLDCHTVGGAGTGTFEFEAASGVYNELQPGSYIFMDADYGRNRDANGQAPAFEHSLFVYTTVMSQPTSERAIVDAGTKAVSLDSGPPLVVGSSAQYGKASDEHGTLDTSNSSDTNPIRLGDKLKLIPGHCDPTVNLHDWFIALRGDRVEALWPISARGGFR